MKKVLVSAAIVLFVVAMASAEELPGRSVMKGTIDYNYVPIGSQQGFALHFAFTGEWNIGDSMDNIEVSSSAHTPNPFVYGDAGFVVRDTNNMVIVTGSAGWGGISEASVGGLIRYQYVGLRPRITVEGRVWHSFKPESIITDRLNIAFEGLFAITPGRHFALGFRVDGYGHLTNEEFGENPKFRTFRNIERSIEEGTPLSEVPYGRGDIWAAGGLKVAYFWTPWMDVHTNHGGAFVTGQIGRVWNTQGDEAHVMGFNEHNFDSRQDLMFIIKGGVEIHFW